MVSYNEPLFGDYVTAIELIHGAGHHRLLSTPTMCADSEVPLAVAPGRVLGSGIFSSSCIWYWPSKQPTSSPKTAGCFSLSCLIKSGLGHR